MDKKNVPEEAKRTGGEKIDTNGLTCLPKSTQVIKLLRPLDDCIETWVWSSMHGKGKIIPTIMVKELLDHLD